MLFSSQDKLIDLIFPVHSASLDMSHKHIRQLFQACTQTAASSPSAGYRQTFVLSKKKRTRIELQILNKPGVGGGSQGLFYPPDVSPQLVHSSFEHFSSEQTDGCFVVASSRPCLERVAAEALWWQETGALCGLLLIGGTLRQSTFSPFTPTSHSPRMHKDFKRIFK